MNDMLEDNSELKKYLLGSLTESVSEELDMRLIAEEAFADEILLAEHELIEDHIEGSLSSDDEARFESTFLISPERRALLRETSLLKELARKELGPPVPAAPLQHLPAGRRSFLSLYFRPLLAVAAVLLAVLAVGLLWNSFIRQKASPLETEFAALNNSDLSDLSRLSNLYPVNLSPDTFRDAASVPKHNLANLTEMVLFRLALRPNANSSARFRAVIRRSGTPDFTLNAIPAYRNTNGNEIRLLLPASILQKGQYELIIESNADNAVAGNYAFAIE
jgi:hypothetical protein